MNRFLRPMLLATTLIVAASAIAPRIASAIEVEPDCSDVVQAAQGTTPPAVLTEFGLNDTDESLLFILGQQFGVPAFLRNLLCFTGDPRCSCLESLLRSESSEAAAYLVKVREVVDDCAQTAPTRSFSGIAQEATLAVCN